MTEYQRGVGDKNVSEELQREREMGQCRFITIAPWCRLHNPQQPDPSCFGREYENCVLRTDKIINQEKIKRAPQYN